jgi:hypothetical protein
MDSKPWDNASYFGNMTSSTTSSATTASSASVFICSSGILLHRFVIHVVLSLPIASIGIVFNLLAFVVLRRQKQSANTGLILQALAVTDLLLLACSISSNSLRYLHHCTKVMPSFGKALPYIHIVVHPLVGVMRTICTWLTTLLTIDRWVAVCRPLHAQRVVTRKRTMLQITCIVIASFLFNLPRFVENFITPYSRFMKHPYYNIIYVIIINLLVMYIIPMGLLLYFNIRLIKTLKYSEKDRASLQALQKQSAKKSVTAVVVAITTTFIICNSMAFISRLLFSISYSNTIASKRLENASRIINNLSNLFVVINSAVNFFIYFICSKTFRQTSKEVFCCVKAKQTPETKKRLVSSTRFTPISYLTNTRSSTSSAEKYNQEFPLKEQGQ